MRLPHTILIMAAAGFALSASPGMSEDFLYLRDGRVLEGIYQGIKEDRISWGKEGSAGAITIPMAQVDYIEFPEPPVWQNLMATFASGDYETAAQGFLPVSNQKFRTTHYPAPGNFANLAERRLLDCYRRLRKWEDLRYVVSVIEWDKLPLADREIEPVMKVWAAIGGGEWDRALQLAGEAEGQVAEMANELGFARAMAYKGKGDANGAVIALAEAYGPYPGMDRELAREALIEASNILREDPERQPEFQALVHIYAGLFGNGKLWDGAPKLAQELLEGEPVGMAGPATSKGRPGAAGAEGGVKARYLRIQIPGEVEGGMRIGEVEVMSGDYNIAKEGTAKLSEADGKNWAGHAIDGDKRRTYAATAADETDPWWELDLGRVKPVDSVVVWSSYSALGKVSKRLKGYDVILYDGERKEVFAVRAQPLPDPSHEIPVAAQP